MRRNSEKFLAISLAIFIGLVQLNGAMAGVVSYFSQNSSAYEQMDMHHDTVKLTADHSSDICDKCGDQDTCTDHACSTDLCTSCPVALFTTFSFSTNRIASSALIPSDDNLVDRHSSSLFRPPKV